MMELKWKRTEIGGEACKNDFIAYCDRGTFARLMRKDHGPSSGVWGWYLSASRNPFFNLPYGTCDSKQEAVDTIVRMFGTLQAQGKLEFHPPPPQRRSSVGMD